MRGAQAHGQEVVRAGEVRDEVARRLHANSHQGFYVPRLGDVTRSFVVCALACLVLVTTGCVSARERSLSTDEVELIKRADLAFELGARKEALELYSLAAVAAQTNSEKVLFVEASAMVGAMHALLGQPAEARPWLSQAGPAANPSETGAFSRLLLAQGLVARAEGKPSLARQRFDELYTLTRSNGMFARTLQAASLAALVSDQDESLQWMARAVEAARDSGEPRWEAAALASEAWALEKSGDFQGALQSFRASRKLYGEHGKPRARLKADWSLGHGLRKAGKSAAARALMERVLTASKSLRQHGWSPNDSEWVARSHEELALLSMDSGHWDDALRHLAAARRSYLLANAESLAPERLRRIDELGSQVQAKKNGAM